MIELPEELIFYVFTFMNFKSKDFIKTRNVCNLFKNLMDKPITVDCYPHLIQESFTSFTVSYNQHMNYLKQLREEANIEFDITYLNMLTENGWV